MLASKLAMVLQKAVMQKFDMSLLILSVLKYHNSNTLPVILLYSLLVTPSISK